MTISSSLPVMMLSLQATHLHPDISVDATEQSSQSGKTAPSPGAPVSEDPPSATRILMG